MLDSMRKASGTWVAKLLLALLVVSFAVWGISGTIFTGVSSSVVTAGSTTVSAMDYRLAYDRQISVMSQQFGTRLTREQAQAFGIDDQVLAQLVAGAVLDEQASQMGLGLSRDRVALLTAEDPAFRNAGGRFDRQQFEFVLRQVGMTPEEYLRNREQVAIRQQIVEAVSDDIKVPQAFLKAMALYRGEDRTAEFVAVPRSAVEPVPAPTDAQLSEYFEANKARYAAPEYRKIAYVKLEPSDIADESSVTDEMIAAEYERTRARFTQPEKRTIEQIVFADEAAANAAAARLREGATFEELVTAEGKTMADVQLGTFSREDVADPAIAEAAFALQQGQTSGVVRGGFGHLLLRVTQVTPEVIRPLSEVSAEIRRDLAIDDATRAIADVHTNYEDARAGGEGMAEAAQRFNLRVVTIDAVDQQGRAPDGSEVKLPEKQQLLQEAFESDVGVENPAINLGAVGFLFYEVLETMPARDRTLDEVRDRLVADWTDQEARSKLAALAGEMRKQLDAGTAFAEVAAAHNLEVQTKRGLKREGNDADFDAAGVAAVFGVVKEQTGVTPGADGNAQIVFKVTEVTEPLDADAASVPQQTADSLSRGLADDLLDQLVAKLQGQYGVSVNRNAMAQALSF